MGALKTKFNWMRWFEVKPFLRTTFWQKICRTELITTFLTAEPVYLSIRLKNLQTTSFFSSFFKWLKFTLKDLILNCKSIYKNTINRHIHVPVWIMTYVRSQLKSQTVWDLPQNKVKMGPANMLVTACLFQLIQRINTTSNNMSPCMEISFKKSGN